MSPDDQGGLIGGVVAALIAIGGGVTVWQRTRSRDSVETAKDRAEEGLVERLQARADAAEKRADALFDELQRMGHQHTDDVRVSERCRAELAHLVDENTSLRRNLRRMAERLPPEQRQAWEQALETDFAPLDKPEKRP
jgi:3-hydroxyacyl-CoA dehydrogenase